MLTVVYDGVKAFVVPDCAECILAEKHPDDMDECPLWKCEATVAKIATTTMTL